MIDNVPIKSLFPPLLSGGDPRVRNAKSPIFLETFKSWRGDLGESEECLEILKLGLVDGNPERCWYFLGSRNGGVWLSLGFVLVLAFGILFSPLSRRWSALIEDSP